MTSMPVCCSGCQTLNTAPAVSPSTAIRPLSITSIAGASTLAPAASAAVTVSSVLAVLKTTPQNEPSSGFCAGPIPQTILPPMRAKL